MKRNNLIVLLILVLLIFITSCRPYEGSNPIYKPNVYTGYYKDLIVAADNEDLDAMNKIVKNNSLNLNYSDPVKGLSLLNWCLLNRKEKSFERLLQLGANPNWQDSIGYFPAAIIEAAKQHTTRYLALSLKHNGNVNLLSIKVKNEEDQTPLLASMVPFDYMDNIKMLVEHGANVNLTPVNHSGPLTEALLTNRIEIAKYLIDHGADYNHVKFWTQTVALDENKEQILDSNDSPVLINDKQLNILDFLRLMTFSLHSKEYNIKMEVATFLKTKGLDYWATPIPKAVKNQFKNDPDYLLKY
jgi:ankyrin repeat protein